MKTRWQDKKIIIIGAGPAGSTCAITLLQAGVKNVTLVTNSKTGKFHIGESIPPNMNLLMKQLGIFESFLAQNHEPCFGSCSYWGSNQRGYNDTILNPFGYGWHLDRREFNEFMLRQASQRGAVVLQNCNFHKAEKTETGYLLKITENFDDEHYLRGDFIVDATGSKCSFAIGQGGQKIQGVSLICLGLRYSNIGEKTISKLTHLEAVENGWWYATRIPKNKLLITFYTRPEIVKEFELHKIENWKNHLKNASNTHKWSSNMESIDEKIIGFNAPSFILDHIVGENWLAIGDAAMTFDPITSQGIIKAVGHGMLAAKTIENYFEGSEASLIRFERKLRNEYKQYEESRKYYYYLEQRWPKSLFWKKMHNLETNIFA